MAYALPVGNLVTLALPGFFGSDTDAEHPYWGFYVAPMPGGRYVPVRHNPAETAAFVGIIPWLRESSRWLAPSCAALRRAAGALGSPHRLLRVAGAPGAADGARQRRQRDFYFLFRDSVESGSPARCLALWALAWSVLAGFGLDAALARPPSVRELLASFASLAAATLVGFTALSAALAEPLHGIPTLPEALAGDTTDWVRVIAAALCGLALLSVAARRTAGSGQRLGWAAVVLVAAELFWVGIDVNPTAAPADVYPLTPGLDFVRQHLGHNRVFPVNVRWSL